MLPIGRSPSPGEPRQRDVDLVLSRSPINLANLVTLGRLVIVVPAGLADRHRSAGGSLLAVHCGRRVGRCRRLIDEELQRQELSWRVSRSARRQGPARRHVPRAGDRSPACRPACGDGDGPRSSDRGRRGADAAPRSVSARCRAIGKINTFAAFLLAASRSPCRRLDQALGRGHRAIVLVATTTALSGAGYAGQAIRERRRSGLLEPCAAARPAGVGAAADLPSRSILFGDSFCRS